MNYFYSCLIAPPKSPESDDAEDISSEVVEKSGEKDPCEITPDRYCDGYSCNGLKYERTAGNETFRYGECQRAYCFVKEGSSCTKFESKEFPGKFISTQACDHPLAPNPSLGRASGTGELFVTYFLNALINCAISKLILV